MRGRPTVPMRTLSLTSSPPRRKRRKPAPAAAPIPRMPSPPMTHSAIGRHRPAANCRVRFSFFSSPLWGGVGVGSRRNAKTSTLAPYLPTPHPALPHRGEGAESSHRPVGAFDLDLAPAAAHADDEAAEHVD